MFSSYCRRATAGLGALCLACSAPGVSAQITLPSATTPAAVSALEYFVDTDPGVGQGTPIPVTPGADVSATASIPLIGLPVGIHRIYFRAKGTNGAWGLSTPRMLYIAPGLAISAAAVSPVSALEYFFDTDPGPGQATALTITAGTDITSAASIGTASLSAGVHYLGIRSVNAAGHWGLTNLKAVYVIPAISLAAHKALSPILRAEYFVDTDPGSGLATPIPLTAGTDVSINGFIASLGAAAAGVHQIGVRFQDAAGNWSLTDRNRFAVIVANINIPPAAAARPFTTLEYFFDTDPGLGNGSLLTVPATTDLNSFSFAADISTLSRGAHVLYVRTAGEWSITSSQAFTLASPLPVGLLQFDARRLGNAVRLSWEIAQPGQYKRFAIERSNDAALFDSIGMVDARTEGGQSGRHSFQDERPLRGTSYYRLRQTGPDGSISYSRVIPVRIEDAAPQAFSCNNPVGNELRIFWSAAPPHPAGFSIINLQGQEVKMLTGKGSMVETFDISQLPAGSYFLRHNDAGKPTNIRFQKR